MKYKIKKEEIIEDNEVFKGFNNLHELARITGINVSYLCNVRNGKRIVSEETYLRLRSLLHGIDR